MIKPILLASAFALAASAAAQTATNDDQSAPVTGSVAADVPQEQTKVMTPAQNPTVSTPDTDDDENDSETTDDASVAITDSATTTQVDTAAGTQTPAGRSGTTGAAAAGSGMGGPLQPVREYPACSRTVTDSCVQVRSSPRPKG